jgi:hypothetical protein
MPAPGVLFSSCRHLVLRLSSALLFKQRSFFIQVRLRSYYTTEFLCLDKKEKKCQEK